MNKKIHFKIIITLLSFFVLFPSTHSFAQEDNRFEISKNLDVYNAIIKELEMFYVDSVDVEKIVRTGIDAMLRGLDPYTEYIPEQQMDDFKFLTTGEYGGIGAYIRKRDEGVVITEPFEGMPAELAGLKAGDLILAIDDINVEKENDSRVSELLKGAPNTKLVLKIQRPGETKPRTFELVRKQILVDQVTWYGVRGDGTGYIHMKGFTDKSTQEVKNAFLDLKNNHQIKSLILDLRSNGGGLLESAVQIVNMFVPKGTEVVSTKGKLSQWDRTYRTSSEPIDTIMPLAVLINGESASAAEIVAGALQDMDRAVIIGQRSFGKGLVQAPRELPYNNTLKVTISKYYIPSGRCIQQIDYSHRSADGKATAIPDSLTTVFYTQNGRPVRDGGGIRPDFEVEEKDMPTLLYYIMFDNITFDFATGWAQKHKTIPAVEEFEISDEDFEAFKAYAKEKNFTYDKQSEKMLANLEEVAALEGYLKSDSTIFNELRTKLQPDLDRDFERFKEEIKGILSAEIIKRYYYQKGKLIYTLKEDAALEKAIEVLSDPEIIRQTLSNPGSAEEKTVKITPVSGRKRTNIG
ncbi:MAG: S41 family peptidase [Tannerellaceae bacterium]|nr:S41 family peptidase [Tannerellaceae bacterium]